MSLTFPAYNAFDYGRNIMFAMMSFITGLAKAVSGVPPEFSAFETFYSRRIVSAAILAKIAGFAMSKRALGFQLAAAGTDDFLGFIAVLILFPVAVFAKPLCIMPLLLAALTATNTIYSSHRHEYTSIECNSIRIISNCQ